MNSVYFHGTTDDVIPEIKHDGLKPAHERAFGFKAASAFGAALFGVEQIQSTDTSDAANRAGFVHLTRKREVAEYFAQFRSQYETFPPGVIDDGSPILRVKQPGEFVRHGKPAKPVIVEVHLTPELDEALEPDEFAADTLEAYRVKATIPPSTITHVYPVKPKKESHHEEEEVSYS